MTDTGLQIDFGKALGVQPHPPSAPALEKLGTASASPPEELVCYKLLSPEQLEEAKQIAKQQYPQLLESSELLGQFGRPAVEGINAQVDQILKTVGRVSIPELTEIMHQVNDRMRGFRRKHDPNDPKNRQNFDNWVNKVKQFFRKAHDWVQMLLEDARREQEQLDRIAGKLIEERQVLERNVVLCDDLYQENEKAIVNLVAVTAVMELVHQLAVEEDRSIVIDPSDPHRRDKEERKRLITQFIMNMEIRITEFKQRLFVAWATSPQITNIRTVDFQLQQRLYLLVDLTIPTMKLTIAEWAQLMEADQAAQMQEAVAEGANESIQAFAGAAKEAIPRIERVVQNPTLLPETIDAVAESIQAQADGIIDAVRMGRQKRAEVETAIVRAKKVMTEATEKMAREVTAVVTDARQPLALPAAPVLPEVVRAVAKELVPA